MPDIRVGVITGANQGIGRAVAAGLAREWCDGGVVYVTGRDRSRVDRAAAELAADGLSVAAEVCDVRDDEAVRSLASRIGDRHGGVDFVDSNATAGITPGVPHADEVGNLIATNNLGATRMIRAFGPLLRPGGRLLVTASSFGTLGSLAAELWPLFDTETMTLDDVDRVMLDYAAAVRSGTAVKQGWPEWINIPSKIGQVAAIRIYARLQRDVALRDGQLIAAVCPGLVDTRASRPWFADMSAAQTPDAAATDIVKLAAGPVEPSMYGELVQHGRVLPWLEPRG